MIQVWKIDNKGFLTDSVIKDTEELTDLDITTPVNTSEMNTYYKPKWTGTEWIEGWAAEEIEEWQEQNSEESLIPPLDEIVLGCVLEMSEIIYA